MTNQEAITELKREIQWGKADFYPYVSKSMIEACEKAIKALEIVDKMQNTCAKVQDS